MLYQLPVVRATVNGGRREFNQPTIHQITDVLTDTNRDRHRTSINAWKTNFVVRAVRRLAAEAIMAALLTEVCRVSSPSPAIAEGFEVYPVVDCVAGNSVKRHEAGLRRLEQAVASLPAGPAYWELQRAIGIAGYGAGFAEILFAIESLA